MFFITVMHNDNLSTGRMKELGVGGESHIWEFGEGNLFNNLRKLISFTSNILYWFGNIMPNVKMPTS